MKIRSIDTFVVRLRADEPLDGRTADPLTSRHPGLAADHPGDITTEYPPLWRSRAIHDSFEEATHEAVIVRLETDSGIVGWGEAHAPAAEAVRSIIETTLAPLVYGRDPLDIHPIWETLYSTTRMGGSSSGYLLNAIGGIDIALHDAAGKALNVPAAKLMGGPLRDRVPVHASCLPYVPVSAGEAGVQGLVEAARALLAQGYKAIKVRAGGDIERDRHTLRLLREALGPECGIAVNAGGAYDLALARWAGQMMADDGVLWLEDPLMPEHARDYARLAEFLDLAVAGGSGLTNRWAFNDALAAGAFDIVQADIAHAGGLSECRRISMLADVYGLPYAPRMGHGTAIYRAATLQWAAAGANLMTCEWPIQPTALDFIEGASALVDGFVHVTDAPGLGVQVDEAKLQRQVG